jgi:putative membrane protein
MKAENFFTDSANAEIGAAIKEVEKNTTGEIAVMVVDESDSYPEGNILSGVIIGGLVSLVVTELFFGDSLTVFAIFFAGLSLGTGWITEQFPALKRIFIPKNRMDELVLEQAVQSFYEKGLHKTRDATGVFFFISLFEHKVWILADSGIYSRISQQELQIYASDMAKGIRQGNAAEILCREIAKLGEVLAQHFPAKPDDENELSNQVIVG